MDETCVKVNGLEYWVYAALDVDRDEILSMRVYPSRNILTTKQFIDEVLNYCVGRPEFIVDNVYGLKCIGGVRINVQYKALSVIEV